MRIENERMWTEFKADDHIEVMGTLKPMRRGMMETPITRVQITVSEDMYVVMNSLRTNTPSAFEVFIEYLQYLISSGETLTSKSGVEFIVVEYCITFDQKTKKNVAEVNLISVNRYRDYKEIDKRELLTTLVESTPVQ